MQWVNVTNTKHAIHWIAIYTVEIVNEQLGPDDLARLELPLDTLPNVTNCGHRSQDLSKC